MEISLEEFNLWMDFPATRALFKLWQAEKQAIEREMLNTSLILSPDGQLRLSLLAGERKCLETFLELSNEDLSDDEESNPVSVQSADQSVTSRSN